MILTENVRNESLTPTILPILSFSICIGKRDAIASFDVSKSSVHSRKGWGLQMGGGGCIC